MRDKDYKKARDYCHRQLLLQKLLRKGEQDGIKRDYSTKTEANPIVIHEVLRARAGRKV